MEISNNKFNSLYEMGFSVFPVKKGDKKPAIKWTGYQHSKPTDDEISFWDSGDFNVGIVCGKVSNLVVIDIDSDEAQVAYEALEPPTTPCVRTAKGRHYYYLFPAIELRNRVRVGEVALDVRGEGGYVVGPGSLHESGITYEWEVSPAELQFADLTPKMLEAFGTSSAKSVALTGGETRSPSDISGRFGLWLADQLEEAASYLARAKEGTRNDTLNNVAFYLARHVAAAQTDWTPFADRLLDASLRVGLGEMEAVRTIESAWEAGRLVPIEWISTAKAYAYASIRNQFYHIAGKHGLSAGAFDLTHNSERRGVKGKISQFLTDNDLIEKVTDLRFEPQQPTGVYEFEGQRWLNTYVAPDIVPCDGDAAPVREFLEYLVPSEVERAHLERMIAWTVRYPGQKLSHALLFRSEHQGVGKSMLLDIWCHLLGKGNTRLTTTEEINGNFQSFIEGNLLVLVEELNLGFGPQGYNRIKNLITGHTAEVNEKFVSSRERPNHATFAFLTNLAEPILIEDTDRRFFFVDSPATPRDPTYYKGFADWWQGNLGIVRHYFDCVDLEDFNPFAPPPETEARKRLKSASRPPLEQDLMDAIAERRWPFGRDVVQLQEIKTHLPFAYSVPTQRLQSALRALGCVPLSQLRVPGEWVGTGGRPIFVPGAETRPSCWAIANVEFWQLADNSDRVDEFCRQRGMWVSLDGRDIAVCHSRSEPAIHAELTALLAD